MHLVILIRESEFHRDVHTTAAHADDWLALNGDECGDTEPGKIALRNSCRGDSETLTMGYARGGHGNRECWSQGNHWGNLIGMFVLVQ